jgi:hypothetical protein
LGRVLGRTIVAAVVAAGLLLPSAALAQRTVPKGFFGVVADRAAVDGSVPMQAQMRHMRRVGAESVGLVFNWVDAQPYEHASDVPAAKRGRFVATGPDAIPTDWSVLDRRVAAAARAGLIVRPVVIAAPRWARLHPALEFSPPKDPAQYAAFVTALVQRYGPRGTFWSSHPKLPAMPIRSWQIWNEPVGGNGDTTPSVFWSDDEPFQDRFVALMRASYAAVKAADPTATVVQGALVGKSWLQLQRIYEAGGAGTFDAVALHPYTVNPDDVLQVLRNVREVMAANGDGAKPIDITEITWPAFDITQVLQAGYSRTVVNQAWWLRKTFQAILRERTSLGISLVLWYTWIGRDRSDADVFDHAGLLNLANGTLREKPALRDFRRIVRRAAGNEDRS